MRQTRSLLLVCLATLFLCSTLLAQTQDKPPEFADTILTTSDDHLIFFTSLKNSLSDEMIQGLKSGIPLEFTFFVVLEKVKSNWPDTTLVEIEFKHTLTYDTLKETYTIELGEKGHKTVNTKYLSEAQNLIGSINGLELFPLDKLQLNTVYSLKFRTVLYKKTLPLGLHRVTPFISWWDVETEWQKIEFTY